MAKPPVKPPAPKPQTDEERAQASLTFKEMQQRDGALAMAEYLANAKAERDKTAKLRAMRLAKEAAEARNAQLKAANPAPKPALKPAVKALKAAVKPKDKPKAAAKPPPKPAAKPPAKSKAKAKAPAKKKRL